jgi:hypothetical protein
MIRKLFRVVTHVQPLDTGLFNDIFIVVTLPVWRSFCDDWTRYGLSVALHNFKYLMR